MLNSPLPQHTHDCDDCILIANIGKTDLYVCCTTTGRDDSIIEREGSEPDHYSSLPAQIYRATADLSSSRAEVVRLYDAFIAGRNSL